MAVTHFCTAANKAAMLSLLANYSGVFDGLPRPLLVNGALDPSFCDDSNGTGIQIADGQGKPVAGYFWNVMLDGLDRGMPGLQAAADSTDPVTGAAHLVYGAYPASPQRVFA